MKISAGYRVFTVFNTLFMLFLLVITLYPMYYCVVASFSDPDALARAAYFARRDDKIKLFRGAVDDSGLTWHDLSDAILSVARERGKKCSWSVDCFNRGAYTCYTVRWTKW